jgi:hypothetical protein
LDDASHNEAADHFTAAINSSAFTSESKHLIHLKYEVFVVVRAYYSIENIFIHNLCSVQLFGWDLKSLWQTANQKRCHALLQAGRLAEAQAAYRYMM